MIVRALCEEKTKNQKPERTSEPLEWVAFLFPRFYFTHLRANTGQWGRRRKNVSKEEILDAIKKMAEELGRAPSLPELRNKAGISPRRVRRKFLNYPSALKKMAEELGRAPSLPE